MTFITGGIRHTDMKVLKIRFPMPGKNKLEGLNIKAIRQELADRTDDFRIGQRMKRINLNTTKQLVMNITV